MSLKYLALAAIGPVGFAASASAQVDTYHVSGAFSNGSTFSGSFSLDPNGQALSQFSDINIVVSGLGTLHTINSLGYNPPSTGVGPFSISFFQQVPAGQLSLFFQADHDDLVVKSIANQGFVFPSSLALDSGTYLLTRGSITRAVAGVPEPATWAMMIVGFGAIGGAIRRYKQVEARVRFA